MAEAKAVRFGPIQQLNVYAHVDINFRCFHSPSMRSRLSEAFEVKRIAVYYIHILILKFLFLFLSIPSVGVKGRAAHFKKSSLEVTFEKELAFLFVFCRVESEEIESRNGCSRKFIITITKSIERMTSAL